MHLMIPGPIALSPAVTDALAAPPPSHTDPALIAAFGRCLDILPRIFGAPEGSKAFVVSGSGTTAMEAAVTNLVDPGQVALVVDTGVFSDRMAQILDRRGARIRRVSAPPGQSVSPDRLTSALASDPTDVVCITHVDTSTGVRVDLPSLARIVADHGALSIVDGVCAAAAEAVDLSRDGIDLYLTASQKAIGAPPGLALWVASPRALAQRRRLQFPPPFVLDFTSWQPIMDAYHAGRPSYFATPATSLIGPLDVALGEIEAMGIDAVVARHATVGRAMRRGFAALGLTGVAVSEDVSANTLSALTLPDGIDPGSVVRGVASHGIVIAGGLHPQLASTSVRIGHMGWVTTQPAILEATLRATGQALVAAGHPCDPDAAVLAFRG